MKTKKTKKLTLNTETLRNLQDADLKQVVGGAGSDVYVSPSTEGNAGSGCTAREFIRG